MEFDLIWEDPSIRVAGTDKTGAPTHANKILLEADIDTIKLSAILHGILRW